MEQKKGTAFLLFCMGQWVKYKEVFFASGTTMVRADGLMLVGERQSRETVIQDCNSYIKVFETCHLICVFQMPCLFNVDTENMPELLKRDLCKCKLFAELCLYIKEIEGIFFMLKNYLQDYLEKNNLLRSCREFVRECQVCCARTCCHLMTWFDY